MSGLIDSEMTSPADQAVREKPIRETDDVSRFLIMQALSYPQGQS